MSDDARIAEIEEILRSEAGLSMVVGSFESLPGFFALSFPVGHRGGVVVGTPIGRGETEVDAAESLLAEWRARK